jgi:hypothetical protein
MPWKIYEENDKYCIHKKNADGSKGAIVSGGCHSSRSKADNHMKALYASESKEIGIVEKAINMLKDLVHKEKEEPVAKKKGDFLLFKDVDERLRFVVRYSNNFRDDDYPVKEIISENSHRRFVSMVDKGMYPMPELQLWHVPEWKFGEADWLAYDDSGFAMASGLIDKGKEHIAKWVADQEGVRTSHGMPPESIVRDPEEPTVIIEHQTEEISPLPAWAAANKMTGFYILDNESKEKGMAIPENKISDLMEKWKADPEILDQLQKENEQDALRANSEGIESKEVSEPEQKEPEAVEAETETKELPVEEEKAEEESQADEDAEVANKEAGDSPTREEIAEAVVAAIRPLVETHRKMADEIAEMKKEISHLKDSDEQKIAEVVKETPVASVSALIANRLSVTNTKETEVDGRTSLAKSRPSAAEEQDVPNRTGISFLDNMLAAQPDQ